MSEGSAYDPVVGLIRHVKISNFLHYNLVTTLPCEVKPLCSKIDLITIVYAVIKTYLFGDVYSQITALAKK